MSDDPIVNEMMAVKYQVSYHVHTICKQFCRGNGPHHIICENLHTQYKDILGYQYPLKIIERPAAKRCHKTKSVPSAILSSATVTFQTYTQTESCSEVVIPTVCHACCQIDFVNLETTTSFQSVECCQPVLSHTSGAEIHSSTLNEEVTAISCYETLPKHPDHSIMLGSLSTHTHEKPECSPAAISYLSLHAPYDLICTETTLLEIPTRNSEFSQLLPAPISDFTLITLASSHITELCSHSGQSPVSCTPSNTELRVYEIILVSGYKFPVTLEKKSARTSVVLKQYVMQPISRVKVFDPGI